MESIVTYFSNIGIDFSSFLKIAGILIFGSLLICSVSRFIFRKQTLLAHAVSSSIAILFIYLVMVLILTVATRLSFLAVPLPFVSISDEVIHFFSFENASYTLIASQLLSMITLAFLVNMVDNWMPKSKNLLKWIFWRVVTIALGFLLHCMYTWLFNRYLPEGIVLYAPAILLAILIVMLLTGALKGLLGLLLATVNPLIAALYTFFFANVIGKQVTKAVLTTAILSGITLLLQDMGIRSLSLPAEALVAYIPFMLILIPVWYLVNRL